MCERVHVLSIPHLDQVSSSWWSASSGVQSVLPELHVFVLTLGTQLLQADRATGAVSINYAHE